jgi:hypothetical protein
MLKKMSFITFEQYKSINECKCGGPVFKYHNSSKNTYHVKCGYFKKVLETCKETSKKVWVVPKKINCDWSSVYNGPRPVFKEINEKIIKHVEKNQKDIHKKLEDQLKILFSFLIVSKNSATLDEINILVKNNLLREPRKTFYLVSTGRFLRVSHYESFEEYRDRIFSKKIVNHFIPEVTSIIQPIVKPVVVKKTVKPKKEEISQFIIVSDDEASDENSETSESEKSDSETDDDRDESDFESVVDFEEIDEFEETEYNDYED